jgi:hypothetical protein
MSKPTIIDERGENLSRIIVIDYREMCHTHQNVFIKTALGNLLLEPAEPAEPAESPEVVSASAAQTLPSTRAGGQDDGS